MTRIGSTFVALAAILLTPIAAYADIISFDAESTGYAIFSDGTVDIEGFTFASVPGGGSEFLYITEQGDGNCSEGGCNSDGSAHTAIFGDYNADGPISMSASGGGTFSLNSLDAAFGFLDPNSQFNALSLTLEADTLAGGLLSQTFALSGTFTTLDVFGWDNLVSLRFIGSGNIIAAGNFAAIDNISVNVTTVPEPAALALLGVGLLGMGLARRKLKN